MVNLNNVNDKKVEALLGTPAGDMVIRRFLLGFEGTARQLAGNLRLNDGEYVASLLEKIVESKLATKRGNVYCSVPEYNKRALFGNENIRKLKDTGFIELRTRLKRG